MDAVEYTYEDAARACGVTTETIRQRARRGKLPRGRPTNTGRPTVLLNDKDIEAIKAGRPFFGQPVGQPSGQATQPDGQPIDQAVQPSAESLIVKVLEGETVALRVALTRERDRAERAETQAAEARTLAEQRNVDLMVARERAAKAEGEGKGLREALAEARRPIWRKLLGWD